MRPRPFEDCFWTSLDCGLQSCRIGMLQPMHADYIDSPDTSIYSFDASASFLQ
jgi:hypothetical protein